MRCPTCNSDSFCRLGRRGILERTVYFWLGFYPWHCYLCSKRKIVRKRAESESNQELTLSA